MGKNETRSLGKRLRVKPFRLKNFFEDICCATLVRWAMPTTPRRTNFYMTKREKNKFKIKTIKTSLSLTPIRERKSKFKLLNEFNSVYKVGINAHQTCSCPKTRKSTHGDYGKNT